MSLSVMQNLLLNNLMYLEPEVGPFPKMEEFAGRRIRSWIAAMDLSDYRDADPDHPPMTGAEEYKQIVRAVRKDKFLMDMRIMCVYTDLSEGGGAWRGALFQSAASKDAVVVFQGTPLVAGSAQWADNFYSANVEDSPHQIKALEWYRQLYKDYHLSRKEITLTGHSKGGNKAKYVCVLDDSVNHCESFDGEGFSDKFLDKYNDRILERQGIIHNHIVNYDYVSLLMNDIGNETFYYGNNYGSGGFTENHMCNTFIRFDSKGVPHLDEDTDGRPVEMMAFDVFCNSFLRSMNDEARSAALNAMNAFLNTVLSVKRTMSANEIALHFLDYARSESNRDSVAYFLAYLIRYEQKNPQVIDLIGSLFTKFSLEGLMQYINAIAAVLNWQKQILFVPLNFKAIQATVAAVTRMVPGWVLARVSGDLKKRNINLDVSQLRELQAMLIQIEKDLRKVVIYEDGTDRKARMKILETAELAVVNSAESDGDLIRFPQSS